MKLLFHNPLIYYPYSFSFGPNVNFLFETHDLKFASPATVSRMGMIFLSDEDLDIIRLIQRLTIIYM